MIQSILTLIFAVLILSSCASLAPKYSELSQKDAESIASDVYIYGYPLVLMGATRDVMTATAYPTKIRAPINQLSFQREGLASGWLDLAQEPMTLLLSEISHLNTVSVLSAWTELVASPTNDKEFVIVGPTWKGKLPAGVPVVRSPTNNAWIISRSGKGDVELIPLSSRNSAYFPPTNVAIDPMVDRKAQPLERIDKMDAQAFFVLLAEEMKHNPPVVGDSEIVRKMRLIGLTPGKSYHMESLPENVRKAVGEGYESGKDRLKVFATSGNSHAVIGNYGTNYEERAKTAFIGLSAILKLYNPTPQPPPSRLSKNIELQ